MKAQHGETLSSPALQAALDYCRDICRKRARNFYYGLKLSPQPQQSALFVVYAWMRGADDLVDGADVNASDIDARIQQFRRATDAALNGRPIRNDPLWLALADTAARFALPAAHFHSMLDGQLDDVNRKQYRAFEELHTYCYRVACTVGLLCIEIWGYENPRARELAIERGIAFQLTNIVRDFKQDFDAGRIYIPTEDFEHHQLAAHEVRDWSKPAACLAMMKEQIRRAESYYQRSHGLEEMIAPQFRPTLWAMTSIYRGLLQKMDNNPSRIVTSKRVRLSTLRKGAIAVRAKWQARGSTRNVQIARAKPDLSGVSGNTTV